MTESQYHGGQASDSKLNPDDPRLSLERSRARQLKKGPIILLVAGIGLLLVATIYLALKPGRRPPQTPNRPALTPIRSNAPCRKTYAGLPMIMGNWTTRNRPNPTYPCWENLCRGMLGG